VVPAVVSLTSTILLVLSTRHAPISAVLVLKSTVLGPCASIDTSSFLHPRQEFDHDEERDEQVAVNNEADAIVEETFLVPLSLSILWVTTLKNGFLGH
jgi:hypothetical protein